MLGLISEPVKAAKANVHAAIQAYLEGEIGAKGMKWFGHDKANAFRQTMKDAARNEAYSEVDAVGTSKTLATTATHTPDAKTQTRLTGAGNATRDYFVMKGKAQAYDDAKVSVDEYLKHLAHDGTNKLLQTAGTEGAITSAASTDAWDTLRDNPASDAKQAAAAKAALAGAMAEATKQKAALAAPAAAWKDALLANQNVDTRSDAGADASLAAGGTTAVAQAVEKVKNEHVGSKSLETAIQGENVGDGLTKMGTLLDLAVPNSGEALKLAVELKIPVPAAPGVFCVIKIEGSAERHQGKDLELQVSLEFGAGWETWGLSVDARFFLFCKARGADTDKALKMLSYGVYRDLTASPVIPEGMATFWATGVRRKRDQQYTATEEAETWAAMIEEYAMAGDDNAFAEAGGGGMANAKLKAGLVEGQGKASLHTMRHWDKKTMTDAGVTMGALNTGGPGGRSRAAADKRLAASNAFQRRTQWNVETQVEFVAGGQKIGAGLKLQRVTNAGTPDARLGFLDVELIGQIPFDAANPESATLLSKIGGQYVPQGLSAIRQIYDRVAHKDDDPSATKAVGTVIDGGADILDSTGAGELTPGLSKALSDVKITGAKSEYMNETVADSLGSRPSTAPEAQVGQHAAKSALQLSIYRKDGKWGFTIAEVKKLELGIGDRAGLGASAQVTAEKTKKIFSYGEDGVNNW